MFSTGLFYVSFIWVVVVTSLMDMAMLRIRCNILKCNLIYVFKIKANALFNIVKETKYAQKSSSELNSL